MRGLGGAEKRKCWKSGCFTHTFLMFKEGRRNPGTRTAEMWKAHPKWCWIHHSSHPRKPPVAIIHIFTTFLRSSLGGMWRTKGEANEKQSDGTKTHHQKRSLLAWIDVEKVIFLNKNAWCRSRELWFLHTRGAHFRTKSWKNCQKVKNGVGRA